MWASYNMECEEKKKGPGRCSDDKRERSALLKSRHPEGTRGGPLGNSEVEEQDDDFKADNGKQQAVLYKLKTVRITEGDKIGCGRGRGGGRRGGGRRGLEGERKKLQTYLGKMRAMTDAMLANASGALVLHVMIEAHA